MSYWPADLEALGGAWIKVSGSFRVTRTGEYRARLFRSSGLLVTLPELHGVKNSTHWTTPTMALNLVPMTSALITERPRMADNDEEWLTPKQVADLFHVEARTVSRWESQGKLEAARTLGQHRRFRKSDVLALIEEGHKE